MADFLLALSVMALAAVATFVLTAVLVLRKLTHANRVAAATPSAAPLSWLASPRPPARLHRRLRGAVSTATLASRIAPAAVTLGDVATEITGRAVAVDGWLVATTGIRPAVRRARLRELTAEVRDIETCAGRLYQVSADWRRHLDQAGAAIAVPPPNLQERLDAVEAALRELPTATGTRAPGLAAPMSPVAVRPTR